MIDTNYLTYLEMRQIPFEPFHFTKAHSNVNHESMVWVLHNLCGRYYYNEKRYFYSQDEQYISFEDPREAAWYDLRWST